MISPTTTASGSQQLSNISDVSIGDPRGQGSGSARRHDSTFSATNQVFMQAANMRSRALGTQARPTPKQDRAPERVGDAMRAYQQSWIAHKPPGFTGASGTSTPAHVVRATRPPGTTARL